MDEYTDVLEVQHGFDGSLDLRGGAEQPRRLTAEDLHLLRLEDIEQVKEIIDLYSEMDVPREHVELFKQHLLQRVDSWFVEVADVGLIYLTNIIPGFTANLQVIFWDKRFGANRREMVRHVLATAFEEFSLTRIAAMAPETNPALANTELRKIGFTKEGVLRKAWREKEDVDVIIFGLLVNEAISWISVPHLSTTVVKEYA